MNTHLKSAVGILALLAIVLVCGKLTEAPAARGQVSANVGGESSRRVLGPVATVGEDESQLEFVARVDTGAATCSLHAAEKQVLDAGQYMESNIGKQVRFRVENRQGDSQWLERTIAEVRKIRTSEGEETRYLVPMTLTVEDVEREVLVSLNDRSRMTYPMLLGRNFLAGEFVVDVAEQSEPVNLLASKQ